MAKGYDLTRLELLWLRSRIEELIPGYLQQYQDEDLARRYAMAHAWNEISAVKDGTAPDMMQRDFQNALEHIKTTQAVGALKAAVDTTKVEEPKAKELPSDEALEVKPTPLSLASGQWRFGWESPHELLRGMFGDRMPEEGVLHRGIGLTHTLGMQPYRGVPATGAFTFPTRTAEFVSNFLWRFYGGLTIGIGPAIQKAIERKTGDNVYPDWADSPQSMAGRIGAIGGELTGLFVPWGLTARAMRLGRRAAQAGIRAGLRLAGRPAIAEVAEVGVKKLVERAVTEVPEAVARVGLPKVQALAAKFIRRAHIVKAEFVAGSPERAFTAFKGLGDPGGFAKAFFKEIKGVAYTGINTELKRTGLSGPLVEKLGGLFRGAVGEAVETQTFDRLMDLGSRRLTRSALAILDQGVGAGLAMALRSTARSVFQMTGEGVPINVQIDVAGKQALSAVQHGMLFGVIGTIPNITGFRTANNAFNDMLRALGWKNAQIRTAQREYKSLFNRLGADFRNLRSKFWKAPNLREMVKTPDGEEAVRIAAGTYRKAFNDGYMPAWANRFKAIMEGGTPQAMAEEMTEIRGMLRHKLFWDAAKETTENFIGAFPRMATGAFLLNAREILTDRDAIAEHPEDFISSIVMSMYFTRHPNMPYIPAGLGGAYKRYRNPDIDVTKMMLSIGGEYFPDLYRDVQLSRKMHEYLDGVTALRDISQQRRSRELVSIALRAAEAGPKREISDMEARSELENRKLFETRRALRYINGLLGEKYAKGELLIDDKKFTERQLLAIHDELAAEYGDAELKSWKIKGEIDRLASKDTLKAFDIIERFVINVRNRFPKEMGLEVAELELPPTVQPDDPLFERVEAYNYFARLLQRVGYVRPHPGTGRVKLDEKGQVEGAIDRRGNIIPDIRIPQPGEKRLLRIPATERYKLAELTTIMNDYWTTAEREWADFIGDPEVHLFADPRIMLSLQNRAIYGHHETFGRFFRDPNAYMTLIEPLNVGNQRLYGIEQNDIIERMVFAGLAKAPHSRQMAAWDDLVTKPQGLGLPDGAEEYYKTARGRYELARAFMEVVPFYTQYKNFPDIAAEMKKEFSPNETAALNQLITILENSGLAFGRSQIRELKEEAIRGKFERMTPHQVSLYSQLEEMKILNPETTWITLPNIGHELQADPDGKRFLEELATFEREGIIGGINWRSGDLRVQDISSGTENYLRGSAAVDYLTSFYKTLRVGKTSSDSPEHIINRIINHVNMSSYRERHGDLANYLTQTIADLAFSRTPATNYRLMRFLHQFGIIKAVAPGGGYNVDNVKRLFSARVVKALKDMSVSSTGFSPAALKEQVSSELTDLREDLKLSSHADPELPKRETLPRFVERTGVNEYVRDNIVNAISDGRIRNGGELRAFMHTIYAPSNEAKEYMSSLRDRDWNGIYTEIKRQRPIWKIQINHAAAYTQAADGTVRQHIGDVGLKVTEEIITGNMLVDGLAADGLSLATIDENMYTGGVIRKGGWPVNETISLLDAPQKAKAEMDDILHGSNVWGDTAKRALVQKRGPAFGGKIAALERMGTTVPIMIGGMRRHFAVTMPNLGYSKEAPKEAPYYKYYQSMKQLYTDLMNLEKTMTTETTGGVFDWTRYRKSSHLYRMIDSVRTVFEKLPAPGTGGDLTGAPFASLNIPSTALSRAMHTYFLSKVYGGADFFTRYHEAEKPYLLGDKAQMDEMKKLLGKRAKNFTNISATAMDDVSWPEVASLHNARDELRGPALAEDGYRLAVVEDEFIPEPDYFLSAMPMSQRVAHAISFAQGYREDYAAIKGYFHSIEAQRSDMAGLFTMLTKDSFQVFEGLQDLHERLGADFILPKSAFKYWSKAEMPPGIEVAQITAPPEKATIIKVPVNALRIMQVMSKDATGTLNTSMEYSLEGPALDYYKARFAPTSRWTYETPGLKALESAVKLLRKAQDGNRHAIMIANAWFKEMYRGSEEMGIYEEPGYPSKHKEHLFSSILANPTDYPWLERSMGFLRTRILRDSVFRVENPHGRQAVVKPPYRDAQEGWRLASPTDLPFMGEMVGAQGDRDVPLHANSLGCFYCPVKKEYVRFPVGPELFEKLITMHGKDIEMHRDMRTLAEQAGVNPDKPAAVAQFMTSWIKGQSPDTVFSTTAANSVGRYFEVLDFFFAGAERTPEGALVARPSYHYGQGVNRRGKVKVGLTALVQRWPGIKGNDTIIANFLGVQGDMSGQTAILNRADLVERAEGDADWDKINYHFDAPESLVAALVDRATDTARIAAEVDPHRTRVPVDLDPTSAADWIDHKADTHQAKKNIGLFSQFNQALSSMMMGQRYLKLRNPDTGEWYFIGPKYRSYNDMYKGGDHLTVQRAIQTSTDSEGGKLDPYYKGMDALNDLYKKMYVKYAPKTGDPERPDFGKPTAITDAESFLIDVLDAYTNPYRSLSRTVNRDSGASVDQVFQDVRKYITRMWGVDGSPANPKGSMNDYLVYRLMSKPTALSHVLAAMGAEPNDVRKLFGVMRRERGDTNRVLTDRIVAAARAATPVFRQFNPGYESVREALARRLYEISLHWNEDPRGGLDKIEYESLQVFADIIQQMDGLPSAADVKDLESAFYGWYEKAAVARYQDVRATLTALTERLRREGGSMSPRMERLLRGQIGGAQRFLRGERRAISRAQTRDRFEKFTLNPVGRPGRDQPTSTMTDREALASWLDNSAVHQTLAGLGPPRDNAAFRRMVRDAREIRTEISNAWRVAREMGQGKLRFSLRAPRASFDTVELTSDMVNSMQEALIGEYLKTYEGDRERALLTLMADRPDRITGWWIVGRAKGVPTTPLAIQRPPLRAAYRYLDKATLGKLAITRTILRNAIGGGDAAAALEMIAGSLGDYGTVVGRMPVNWSMGPNDPLYSKLHGIARRNYVGQGRDVPGDRANAGIAELEEYERTAPLVLQFSPKQMATMTMSEFIAGLTARGITPTMARQMAIAGQNSGGYIDFTQMTRDNPFRRAAEDMQRVLNESLPDHWWEDVGIMSRWMKTGLSAGENPLFRSVSTRMKRFIFDNPDPHGELQKRFNDTRSSLGRLVREIMAHKLVLAHRGEPIDLEAWAAGVLHKDLDEDLLRPGDIEKLWMSWRRIVSDAEKAVGGEKYRGISWYFRSNYFPTSAALGGSEEGRELISTYEHEKMAMGRREVTNSRDVHQLAGELERIVKIAGIPGKAAEYSKERGALERAQEGLIRRMQRLQARIGGLYRGDPTYAKLEGELRTVEAKLERMRLTEERGYSSIHDLFNDIWEVANSIADVEGGLPKWIEGRREIVDAILGSEKVKGTRSDIAHLIKPYAVEMHRFFKKRYPLLIQEGLPAYKELLGRRLGDTGMADDVVKRVLDLVRVGKVTGYLPQYHYNFLTDLIMLSEGAIATGDRTLIAETLERAAGGVIPRPTAEIRHRTGREGWSRNILLSITRYADDVSTFVFRNKIELAVTKAVESLTRKITAPHYDVEKFGRQTEALLSYIDQWKKDIVDVPERDDFLTRASYYIRGIQLISKLGWRASTPFRNISQLFAGFAAYGLRHTMEAVQWSRTEDGRKFLGEIMAPGGIGDLEFMSTTERMRTLTTGSTGIQSKARKLMRWLTNKALWPLQHLPFVGEHAVRELLLKTQAYTVWKEIHNSHWHQEMFKNRSFSRAMLKAHPELKRYIETDAMGNKVEDEVWRRDVWQKRFTEWTRDLAMRAADDAISKIHFEYSEGSRAPVMRTPLGAALFQLKHFTLKNMEMWHRFLTEAVRRKSISAGWGEYMKTREFKAVSYLGLFSVLTHMAKYVLPLGIGWLFRPDWMDLFAQGTQAVTAWSDDDKERIDRLFYRKGATQMLFGPAVSEATTFLNLAFANSVGEPENAAKVLFGLRDMRNLDDGTLTHKVARAVGPSVVADFIRYDVPRLRQTGGRSWPESFFGALGMRYRWDEGESADAFMRWVEGKYEDVVGRRKKYGGGLL